MTTGSGAVEYLYTAWFSDDAARAEDEDAEWVACILISASSADDALVWGDRLAADLCTRKGWNHFLRSSVTHDLTESGDLTRVPRIRHGQSAPDDLIGW